jgi:hypothetical protein
MNKKQRQDLWQKKALEAERKLWLAEHPGCTASDYRAGLRSYPDGAVFQWRIKKAEDADKAMRKAWLDEHPGEEPLPEHLCALDNPYPEYKEWCAKASRWIDSYEARFRRVWPTQHQ